MATRQGGRGDDPLTALSFGEKDMIKEIRQEIDSDKKLGELILYVAQKCEEDPRFGAVKLNKILWKADFGAYVEMERPITGQEYFALEFGPAPRRLLPVLERLTEEGAIGIRKGDHYGYKQERVFALRDANLDLFSAAEIALVDRFIEECWDKNATELSQESHEFDGWAVAAPKETIPYETALIQARPLLKSEEEVARELARRARQP